MSLVEMCHPPSYRVPLPHTTFTKLPSTLFSSPLYKMRPRAAVRGPRVTYSARLPASSETHCRRRPLERKMQSPSPETFQSLTGRLLLAPIYIPGDATLPGDGTGEEQSEVGRDIRRWTGSGTPSGSPKTMTA